MTARPPMAQITWRGGFLLYGEGVDASLLTTGVAKWSVEDVTDAVKMVASGECRIISMSALYSRSILTTWNEHKAQARRSVMHAAPA